MDYVFNSNKNDETSAIETENRTIKYEELINSSNVLAKSLSDLDIYKRPVVLVMGTIENYLLAIMSVIISGNYFILVEKNTPINRTISIIRSLDNPIVLVDISCKSIMENLGVEYEIYEELIESKMDGNYVEKETLGEDIFTIIYTSGTTGHPKGVVISNYAMVSRIASMKDSCNFEERIMVVSAFSTILSIMSFFCIYKSHGTISIMNDKGGGPASLVRFIQDKHPSMLIGTPSWIYMFLQYRFIEKYKIDSLKRICLAGSELKKDLVKRLKGEIPDVEVINWYGATETVGVIIGINIKETNIDSGSIPIGTPYKNVKIHIRDDVAKEVENGEIGELYVETDGLYSNYLPESENRNIIFMKKDNGFSCEYRTGDLVKKIGDTIYYIGRIDNQIKHKGYRIELEEIDKMVEQVECVYEAATVYYEDRIIVFFEGEVDEGFLADIVNEKLPVYMRPYEYIRIKKIIRNNNGKVDRKQLVEYYLRERESV
ncbi:AMP-binding protein [Pseudobutyrivibrio sp. YE44]|uniref:AMP-binding protein n=1 Tax=Pseudobutyrivibrio sp. YE44 TaxID=1520802 RepID=UPI000B832503|nr:AMP-binding protein [Pseudobutyrivibrio sp. YE44]